jgi:flagellar hook protein FlgE
MHKIFFNRSFVTFVGLIVFILCIHSPSSYATNKPHRATNKINISLTLDSRSIGSNSTGPIDSLLIPSTGNGLESTAVTFDDIETMASYSTSIDVFDTLGDIHTIRIYFFKIATNSWQMRLYGDSYQFGENVTGYPREFLTTNARRARLTINFNEFGKPVKLGRSPHLRIKTPWSNGSSINQTIQISLTKIRQLATSSTTHRISQNGRPVS